jgi:hypothetical protein
VLKTRVTDGEGNNRSAFVTTNNALLVQNLPETSKGVESQSLNNLFLLREFFLNSGSNDLNVDGSATSVVFSVEAEANKTKWVTGVRFLFEGVSLEMDTNDFRRFGAATAANTALTNGVLFQSVQSGETINIVSEAIVYMGDFFSYVDSYRNLINSVSAQSDFLSFDFVFDKPVVLTEDGQDKLIITVQDDLTGIDKFEVIARGYQENLF